MEARYNGPENAGIDVVLAEGEILGSVIGPVTFALPASAPGNVQFDALVKMVKAGDLSIAAFEASPVSAPDNPTLRDWRVGLLRWGRLEEVSGKVKALVDKGDPMGAVALESLEYANHVLRSQLLQLRGVFGFTEAEVEESLWRADRVTQGDLSGEWPLPAEKTA